MISEHMIALFTIVGGPLLGVGIAIRLIALGVVPGNRKPTSGMAWLLVILITPGLGAVLFYFFGSTRLGTRRHQRQRRSIDSIAAAARAVPDVPLPAGTPDYLSDVIHLNQQLSAMPAHAGNQVEVIEDSAQTLRSMIKMIAEARSYVHVQFYIAAWDASTDELMRELVLAAERGVQVRMLYDHLGSRRIPGYHRMLRRLQASPVIALEALPIAPLRRRFRRPDLRNHRKILVVDGLVAFTGSQNLIEPSYGRRGRPRREWVDLMVKVRGPVVSSLEQVFATDWYTETGETLEAEPLPSPEHLEPGAVPTQIAQAVPSGPGYATENNLRLFTSLIYGARQRISLTSPYFVPDESLLYAVTTAARRGVEVELFVSERSDQWMVGHAQCSYYGELLAAGVRIYLYRAPEVLHAKHFTIDDDVTVVGSSNMDMRSFTLNYEISLMIVGTDLVQRMQQVQQRYRAASRLLTLEEWQRRPSHLKYLDNVLRLTAAVQ